MDKNEWRDVLISPDDTILFAIEKIDKEAQRILMVVDEKQCLIGVVTDGDIRRYFLKRGNLDASVSCIMNAAPATALASDTREQLLEKMQSLCILHLPIVDHAGIVIGLETLDHLTQKIKQDNWVVFMAGGLGTRLHPLTLDFPKPLVKIGHKPILEILLENFISHGFHQFYFSVNFKASMIQEYFGNGEKWGVTIRYLLEENLLGTAGSLRLLSEKPTQPFFVVNADIMTNVNFNQILEFHHANLHQPIATVCVRQYQSTIPFGVVKINDADHRLQEIEEKPTHMHFVNAGIYLLNPEILNYFSKTLERLDMTHLLMKLIHHNAFVATFPIREYWIDIGSQDNLSKAVSDLESIMVCE